MNIQILGTKKCKKTSKAERFFKERGLRFHFVNLADKGISNGELKNIMKKFSTEDLIDVESKEYKNLNLQYMKYDPVEEILDHPLILKTPIVRFGSEVTCSLQEDIWKEWVGKIKK